MKSGRMQQTRSQDPRLGAPQLRSPTSSWGSFEPLDIVFRALQALFCMQFSEIWIFCDGQRGRNRNCLFQFVICCYLLLRELDRKEELSLVDKIELGRAYQPRTGPVHINLKSQFLGHLPKREASKGIPQVHWVKIKNHLGILNYQHGRAVLQEQVLTEISNPVEQVFRTELR